MAKAANTAKSGAAESSAGASNSATTTNSGTHSASSDPHTGEAGSDFATTGGVAAPSAEAVPVTIRSLMDAGAHFGHQTHRWNPKMLPYIFGERNGVHIINLDLTMKLWARARDYLVSTLSRGGSVLFVGTKQQAREIVREEANRCGGFHVTTRWLGGTLSNFQTIKNSFERMRKIEDLLAKAENPESHIRLKKKEKLSLSRELEKLDAALGGIRGMKRVPDLMFVVDIGKEAIAVAEAHRLRIPVIAMVDTNMNPEEIEFPIPTNDDASRTIKLFVAAAADAVLQGRAEFTARQAKSDDHHNRGEGSSEGNGRAKPAPAAGAQEASTPA